MRVLVTGTSTGIGEATVRRLDRDGHTVFAGVRREEDGRRLQEGASSRLTPVLLDVTDEAAVAAAAKTVADQVGDSGLDGLVNNAGIARGGPIEYLPLEEWRTQLDVNVIGQVAVTQAFVPLLRQAKGRLVFIGSMGGRLATPLTSPYNASKFAIAGIAESLRHELRPFGIKVVLVEPGGVKTPIWDKGQAYADELRERLPAEAFDRYRSLIEGLEKGLEFQMRHAISPDKVADVIMQALQAPRPRARYLVGRDAAVVGITTRLLPDRLRDALVHRLGS
jgi:NAD(P)-dependent dehydrogenase (short-subunit alcohol dehydrogenase family)